MSYMPCIFFKFSAPTYPVNNPLTRFLALAVLSSLPTKENLYNSSGIPALDEKYLVPLYLVGFPSSTIVNFTLFIVFVGAKGKESQFSI